LLEFWTGRGLRRVVVAGSAEEYGSRNGRLQESDEPMGPLSPYGWGKHAACSMTQAWSERDRIPVLWLRPFVVYGPGQQGNMLIPYALRQALRGLPANFTDGRQRRDFVHVDDVAEAFLVACRCATPGFTAVNVGSGQGIAVVDVIEHLGSWFTPPPKFRLGSVPRRPAEPDEQVAVIDRAQELLGWRPAVAWQDGLRELVQAERDAWSRAA
jgi:nucleoside-diphosphate-sugar epimerase